MTSQHHNFKTDIGTSPIDQAHILRSRFLDTFAILESNVLKLLAKSEKSLISETAPLGQRIEALKKLTLNPAPTKNYAAKLAKICSELSPYLVIRSDVVHAKLTVCTCDGKLHAKFCNTSNEDKPFPEVRLLAFDDFEAIGLEVRRLSNQLHSVLTPSPSQHQPKQAATGGP